MKKLILATALILAAGSANAAMSSQWINGENYLINQIGNTTTIHGPRGSTMCTTVGTMTNCY